MRRTIPDEKPVRDCAACLMGGDCAVHRINVDDRSGKVRLDSNGMERLLHQNCNGVK